MMKKIFVVVGMLGVFTFPTVFGATQDTINKSNLVVVNSGTNITGSNLVTQANDLQAQLETVVKDLLSQLSGTMNRMQKIYDSKVKNLIDTSVFKAVACMNFVNANVADVDVQSLYTEYEKGILEEYIGLSADIKRISVGLSSNISGVKRDIEDFQAKYQSQLSLAETNYEATYNQLKSEFEKYYSANDALMYGVADKIQKIDNLKLSLLNLIDARYSVDEVLKDRTNILDTISAPRASVMSIFKGDLDEIIRNYQSKNPEIDYNKVDSKKQEIIVDFEYELDNFFSILFGSNYPAKKYMTQLDSVNNFLNTYLQEGEYQCGAMISSPVNWERTYLTLLSGTEALIPGFAKAENKVYSWREDQIVRMEPLIGEVFKIYYNRLIKSEKALLTKYINQLIASTYYANQQSTSVEQDVLK